MATKHVKASIPHLQNIVEDAVISAQLLGSDEVYLKLSHTQAKALQQSLVNSTKPYLTQNGAKPEPTVRYFGVHIEDN